MWILNEYDAMEFEQVAMSGRCPVALSMDVIGVGRDQLDIIEIRLAGSTHLYEWDRLNSVYSEIRNRTSLEVGICAASGGR